jgi:CHAT domain-containing protein
VQRGEQLGRLPFSAQEAAAIAALVPAGRAMKALGFDANRENVVSMDLKDYRIVHFATHGVLDANHPELSGVVLSQYDRTGTPQDGFLRLHEVYNLDLPIDLVVLSACQTALGKEVKGEGILGLTQGFLCAGASNVVSSLWKVDDKATGELMRLFYRGMLIEGHPPAAALRVAQIRMRTSKRWRAPFYWAGFVLHGDGRNFKVDIQNAAKPDPIVSR